MTQRVLVTGAAGFVGSHLCRRLAADGCEVRALVRDGGNKIEFNNAGIEVVSGDLCEANSLDSVLAGIEQVYHIAALFRPGNASRQALWAANVLGTENLLTAATAAGVRRFVHCSTAGVHGNVAAPPADENSPIVPGDDYEASKAAAEEVVRAFSDQGPIQVVVVRPSSIYGPGDLRILKLVRAIQARRFVMLGDGEVPYQMIYIDDLIEGICRAGTSGAGDGRAYILSDDSPVSLTRLTELLADRLGVPRPTFKFPIAPVYLLAILCEYACKLLKIEPILHRRRVNIFRTKRYFSIARARAELGFEPRTELGDGLDRTIRWYRDHGCL